MNKRPGTSIRAICLDADGVIVNPMLQFSRLLAAEYSNTPEMTRPFFNGSFRDCLEGRAELAEVLPPFLRDWGWAGTTGEFIKTWLAADHVVDHRLIERVQALRRAGWSCCLATSQERNRAAYIRGEMEFERLFDRLFFSCEIGAQKPDPAFYQHVETTLGLSGPALLFWDDAPRNVAAALERGWNAEIYTGLDVFEALTPRYLGLDSWPE